ncbi:MAG: hypothetical protein IJD38_12975, partial [Clostridia bacterium]|nr:hypothetical protein [Clostridia bacterium]
GTEEEGLKHDSFSIKQKVPPTQNTRGAGLFMWNSNLGLSLSIAQQTDTRYAPSKLGRYKI